MDIEILLKEDMLLNGGFNNVTKTIKESLLNKKTLKIVHTYADIETCFKSVVIRLDNYLTRSFNKKYPYLDFTIDNTRYGCSYDLIDGLIDKIVSKRVINFINDNKEHIVKYHHTYQFRYDIIRQSSIKSLGELHRFTIGTENNFSVVQEYDGFTFICFKDSVDIVAPSIANHEDFDCFTLTVGRDEDCVFNYYEHLFALSNEGKTMYYVPAIWNQHACKVYSGINRDPKFFTVAYHLEQQPDGNYKQIKDNLGFIDFQQLINEDIIKKR